MSKRADGSYLLYDVAHSVSAGRQCIGTATASAPAGPFSPAAQPLVCNAAKGGDIDPSSFVDADGSRYLVYKNDGNALGKPPSIWLQPVAADGTTLAGARTKLLTNDRADEGGVIEAPVIVKRASRYVLFFSANGYGGDAYLTSYATSTSLTGPYTQAYRPLMTTASLGGAVRGPGGADVVGNDIVFHGWINDYSARGMYVAALGWANDLPVVRGSRVRYEAERGTLTACVARADTAASGGQVAAEIDNADSSVQLSVYAPRRGWLHRARRLRRGLRQRPADPQRERCGGHGRVAARPRLGELRRDRRRRVAHRRLEHASVHPSHCVRRAGLRRGRLTRTIAADDSRGALGSRSWPLA